MGSSSQKEFIESIRREKFGIGATKSNPLAKMLHEAIVHLSAELYQKDIHFISELLQNAEDNVYGRGVAPSLELVLTKLDIARVGAQATLVLFNNEVGFQREHVEALCAVGLSTKKGKRDSGYIGEKGIGFKSVFLVSRTPIVISNGYRFRFTDEARDEAKIGYVVPQWVDVPTDTDLRQVYGKQQNLPQTIIVLPLRPDKVEPVQRQLKQVSPETLLFLSKLRQLIVREDSRNSLCITRSDVSAAKKGPDHLSSVATVSLSLGSNSQHVSEECGYHLLQQQFPVTHPVEQRREVDRWAITIAFPLLQRINPGQFTGDIYAFLPSHLASGFPFVVNADFLLVSSRETLKFDSPWNIGILECLPKAFLTAFNFFLGKFNTPSWARSAVPTGAREAYRYIPTKEPLNAQLQKVKKVIIGELQKENCVLVDLRLSCTPCDVFCKPEEARLIQTEFRSILVAAADEGKGNPTLKNSQWHVVDSAVQDSYREELKAISVRDMTDEEYLECLGQTYWLLSLSEELYWIVVCFVWNRRALLSYINVPVLKYCKEDGSIALASVNEAQNPDGVTIYMSPLQRGKWLSTWTSAFRPWAPVLFMPAETVRVLKGLKSRESKISDLWTSLLSVVPDLTVRSYVSQLLKLMLSATDRTFIILIIEFIYQCTQEKDVELKEVTSQLGFSQFPIANQFGGITSVYKNSSRILLPAYGSLWPTLSLQNWSNEFVVMSDDYVKIPSDWTSRWGPLLSKKDNPRDMESYRSYLREISSASDLPYVPPPNQAQMPSHLSSTMTVEQANVLLQWVSCLATHCPKNFLSSLRKMEWLPTQEHGRRRPGSCLLRSSFTALFEPSDVPFVHSALLACQPTLRDLGVVTDIASGSDVVHSHLLEISNNGPTNSCDLGKATRLYSYLRSFARGISSQKMKIFVPGTGENWKDCESCVIQNDDSFFEDSLVTVLKDFYSYDLLTFFEKTLKVPLRPTVERYCQLWLKWRTDVREITIDECNRVWRILSEKWQKCDPFVKKEFTANAWVPSRSASTDAFQLSSPSFCFILDDLDLGSLFVTHPKVQFVWYPDRSEKMESALNKVYAQIGVKKLSDCVQAQINIVGVIVDIPGGDSHTSVRILCQGLFRAILAFLGRGKYGFSPSERQHLLSSLSGVVEMFISAPLTRSYTMPCFSPPVTITQDNVLALWSRNERRFYRIANDDPILRDALVKREFFVQLATTISSGLLSEHPLVAEDLTEFLIGLASSGFESSHVDYELRRKNAKLYEEDEIFLSTLQL